jgi:uncharacterized coiled-coil DUF342 family protein
MSYKKVKDKDGLIRDETNNAVINVDHTAYQNYVQQYKNKYNEINKMKNYEEQLTELKSEINEIKNILSQIVNKIT